MSYTFSGATADTINYIQLCNATNNTCSSCNVPFTTITSGTPIPYSTGGTTYGVSAASIAAYLSINGFSGIGSPTYNIGMHVQSTHLNCSSSTAYCSTNTGSDAHLLCMQATYDGTNVTALTQSDNGNAVLQTATTQYAYVANGNNSVFYCTLNTNGSLNTCITTPSTGAPSWHGFGVAFATVSGIQYAYVADAFGTNKIYYCTLNSNGTFNTCVATPDSGAPSWTPLGVTFATVKGTQYAYVASTNTYRVYQCTLNSNGTFNTCSITPASGAPSWHPFGVTMATVNGTQYAYVADNTGKMYQCTLNTNGTLTNSGCTITPASGAPVWTPNGITFATVNGTQYAYVADDTRKMYRCTLNSNGTFNTCAVTPATGAPSWRPFGSSFAIVNGTQYAYVSNYASGNGNMYQCALNADGTFTNSGCNITPASGAPYWSPRGSASAFFTP